MLRSFCLGLLLSTAPVAMVAAAETVWIEAEHLRGIRGYCFPDMNGKTAGHWGLSGPGIAPEWTQGGESEWLSIACGPDDAAAAAHLDVEVPEAGDWRLWVRYRDTRELSEQFAVRIEQAGVPPRTLTFGERPSVDENDELKLLWKWAFGWQMAPAPLVAGPARVTLLAQQKQPGHRQVDCLCLTTDAEYRPRHREKPRHLLWQTLDALRGQPQVAPRGLAARPAPLVLPDAWRTPTFRDQPFLYFWNMGQPWLEELASQDPQRVKTPFHIDAPLVAEFRKLYGGRGDVPIFSDPRIVPTFHAAGPNILDNPLVVAWLEQNPTRSWANLMNYANPMPLTERAKAAWPRFRDRYAGNIAGESLGVLKHDAAALAARVKAAKSRSEVAQALTEVYLAGKAETEKTIFGEAVPNPYGATISCLSVEMTAFSHLCREWGASTVGYENTSVVPSLAMRLAFLRGGARQFGGRFGTYRSSNFGDSATIYGAQGYFYASPKFVFDNWYDVWAGAGMTWYKFDLWQQYLAGASLFYHEQGHDEFWQPGGQSAGLKPVQLSPKGLLVEQFLRLTREHPDRGVPYTPLAFLLDRAHGWDPNGYQPGYFGLDPDQNPEVLRFDRHARMLKEWFKIAYHPYGPAEAAVNTGVTPVFVPGQFGNLFDVLTTTPARRDALAAYPAVILNGEHELSAEWGQALAGYVQAGGTLLLCDDQLRGPGVAALGLPALGEAASAAEFLWKPLAKTFPSQRYRYRPITGGEPLATAPDGAVLAAAFPRGAGKLVFLAVPRGLGIDSSGMPLAGLLLAQLRQGLAPVEAQGEVEWLLNRTTQGWLVGLFNPAGANKPQHGLAATDYAQERRVALRGPAGLTNASEWFTGEKPALDRDGEAAVFRITVPAGGVRIVELR